VYVTPTRASSTSSFYCITSPTNYLNGPLPTVGVVWRPKKRNVVEAIDEDGEEIDVNVPFYV